MNCTIWCRQLDFNSLIFIINCTSTACCDHHDLINLNVVNLIWFFCIFNFIWLIIHQHYEQVGPMKEWNSNLKSNKKISTKFGSKNIKFTKILGQEKFSAKNILGPKIFYFDLSNLTNLNLAWPVITWFDLPQHDLIWLDPNWLDPSCSDLINPDLTYPVLTWLDLS